MRVAKDDVGKTVTLGFLPAGRRQQTRAPRCVREILSSPHQRASAFAYCSVFSRGTAVEQMAGGLRVAMSGSE